MLYRHVFDKISTEFRGISRIYLNFAAPQPREISEAPSLAETSLHFETITRLEQCWSTNNQSSPSISDCISFIMFLKQRQTKCIKRLMAATRGDNNERTLIGMVKRWPLNRGLSSHNVLGLFWDFYYWLLNRG